MKFTLTGEHHHFVSRKVLPIKQVRLNSATVEEGSSVIEETRKESTELCGTQRAEVVEEIFTLHANPPPLTPPPLTAPPLTPPPLTAPPPPLTALPLPPLTKPLTAAPTQPRIQEPKEGPKQKPKEEPKEEPAFAVAIKEAKEKKNQKYKTDITELNDLITCVEDTNVPKEKSDKCKERAAKLCIGKFNPKVQNDKIALCRTLLTQAKIRFTENDKTIADSKSNKDSFEFISTDELGERSVQAT